MNVNNNNWRGLHPRINQGRSRYPYRVRGPNRGRGQSPWLHGARFQSTNFRERYSQFSPYENDFLFSRSSSRARSPSSLPFFKDVPLFEPPTRRPPSPLPGTEEYTQRNIQQTSDLIKRQLNLDNQNSDYTDTGGNESKSLFNRTNEDNSPPFQKSYSSNELNNLTTNVPNQNISRKPRTNKLKKNNDANIDVTEIHDKIIKHISKLSLNKKMNLVNQGLTGYDTAIDQIQKQQRLELSRALRDMINKSGDITNSEVLNTLIPDFGIKIEELPTEVIEKLSSTLDIGFEKTLVDPEMCFKQAEELLTHNEFPYSDNVSETKEEPNDFFQEVSKDEHYFNPYKFNNGFDVTERQNSEIDLDNEKNTYVPNETRIKIRSDLQKYDDLDDLFTDKDNPFETYKNNFNFNSQATSSQKIKLNRDRFNLNRNRSKLKVTIKSNLGFEQNGAMNYNLMGCMEDDLVIASNEEKKKTNEEISDQSNKCNIPSLNKSIEEVKLKKKKKKYKKNDIVGGTNVLTHKNENFESTNSISIDLSKKSYNTPLESENSIVKDVKSDLNFVFSPPKNISNIAKQKDLAKKFSSRSFKSLECEKPNLLPSLYDNVDEDLDYDETFSIISTKSEPFSSESNINIETEVLSNSPEKPKILDKSLEDVEFLAFIDKTFESLKFDTESNESVPNFSVDKAELKEEITIDKYKIQSLPEANDLSALSETSNKDIALNPNDNQSVDNINSKKHDLKASENLNSYQNDNKISNLNIIQSNSVNFEDLEKSEQVAAINESVKNVDAKIEESIVNSEIPPESQILIPHISETRNLVEKRSKPRPKCRQINPKEVNYKEKKNQETSHKRQNKESINNISKQVKCVPEVKETKSIETQTDSINSNDILKKFTANINYKNAIHAIKDMDHLIENLCKERKKLFENLCYDIERNNFETNKHSHYNVPQLRNRSSISESRTSRKRSHNRHQSKTNSSKSDEELGSAPKKIRNNSNSSNNNTLPRIDSSKQNNSRKEEEIPQAIKTSNPVTSNDLTQDAFKINIRKPHSKSKYEEINANLNEEIDVKPVIKMDIEDIQQNSNASLNNISSKSEKDTNKSKQQKSTEKEVPKKIVNSSTNRSNKTKTSSNNKNDEQQKLSAKEVEGTEQIYEDFKNNIKQNSEKDIQNAKQNKASQKQVSSKKITNSVNKSNKNKIPSAEKDLQEIVDNLKNEQEKKCPKEYEKIKQNEPENEERNKLNDGSKEKIKKNVAGKRVSGKKLQKKKIHSSLDDIDASIDSVVKNLSAELTDLGYPTSIKTEIEDNEQIIKNNLRINVIRYDLNDLEKMREMITRSSYKEIERFTEKEVQKEHIKQGGSYIDFEDWSGSILAIKVIESTVLAGNDKGMFYMFCLETGKLLNSFVLSQKPITSICVITEKENDNVTVYVGCLGSSMHLINFKTREIINIVNVFDPIQCMEASWGYIFVGSYKGNLIRYNIKTGNLEDSLTISDSSVLVLRATLEGPRKVLLVAMRNAPVTIRDAMSGLLIRTMEGTLNPTVYTLLLHNNHIYCGTRQHDVLVYTFQDGQLMFKHEHSNTSGVVCMNIVKNLLFVGCYNGNIYVYNTSTNEFITSMPGPGGLFLSMEVAGDMIIAGTKQNHFKAWKLPQNIIRQIS